MIRVGDVHCHWCGDAFEPEGLPSFEGPNFCSDRCEEAHDDEQYDLADQDAYDEARYGGATVY